MAVKFKDYYEILGVPREATPDEIRLGYRLLARQFHPDVAEDKAVAEEKFKEINEAYEILGDIEKRQKYDEIKANWKATSSKMTDGFSFLFGGTGFSDFYEYFFGSGEEVNTRIIKRSDVDQDARGGPRGNDVEADIMVRLDEVLHGSRRSLRLRRALPCPKCSGAGGLSKKFCETCNGSQMITRMMDFDVLIPAGVEEDQQIRLAGQGEPSPGKGRPGDLLVRVRIAKHEQFKVDGADLYTQVEVSPWEAVLGAQIAVPTLDGRTNVRIPAGSHSGQKLRLRGLGMPAGKGNRGDLYLRLHVQVPSFVSDDERTLWEKLSQGSTFNPRV